MPHQRIKICFLTDSINLTGGTERVVSMLSSYFAEHVGWDVSILTLHDEHKDSGFGFSDKIKITFAGLAWDGNYQNYLYMFLSQNKFDVLFTFHPVMAQVISRIRKHFPTLIWIATEHLAPSFYSRKARLHNMWAYFHADRLVVLQKQITSYYKMHMLRNTCCIPNPLSFETEKCADYSAKKIIAVGRLVGYKGFDLLIQAFAILHQNYPDWSLEIVGDGDQKNQLYAIIEKYTLQHQVNLCGFQSDIKNYMLSSSFLVISSETECFPLAALEAMECGLPLVSFELPAIREMIGNYHSCLFAPHKDVEALAARMLELIEDPDKRRAMGNAAKQCAAQYHIEKIGKQWIDLIESLL